MVPDLTVPEVTGARLVVDAAAVDAAFDQLVAALQPPVEGEPCVLLGVLLGGLMPLARIASRLRGDFVMDTCRVGRYGDALRGGIPQWLAPPRAELRDRHVILIDDIYDEGLTLEFIAHHCRQAGARRVTIVALVRKMHSRAVAGVLPDLVGIEVGDEFIFGCGMDYRGHWRHLPGIWAVNT